MKYIDIFETDEPLTCSTCRYLKNDIRFPDPVKDAAVMQSGCSKLSIDISPDDMGSDGRLKNCPIRTLPEKQVCNYYEFETFVNGVAKGWNDCIDHITGEGTVN